MDHLDTEIPLKKRPTRADVLTVPEAIKAQKSSKTHKLPPRSVKRDRTKTKEAKKHSQAKNKSHAGEILA